MKYLPLILALLLTVACSWVVDPRSPADAAATRTVLAARPVSANVGVLRVRLLLPSVTIAPKVLPDWTYTVTPAPKASNP